MLKSAHGVDVAVDEESTEPRFLEFKRRLQERKQDTFIRGSAMMYDATMQVMNAYKGCEDTTCVANNLRSLQNYQGISGSIGYNGDQIVEREIMLTQFEDGRWRKIK